jgi:hypothetical protein
MQKTMAKRNRYTPTNKNSRVNTRIDRTGKLRTETSRRDNGELDIAISTDQRNNSTRVFIDTAGRKGSFPSADVELSGREARTLYLALAKHFGSQGKFFY